MPSPAVVATQDGRHVVTLVGGEVALRDARTLVARWALNDTAIEHMALSPDGRTLLLAGRDGDLDFVDIPSGAVRSVHRPQAIVQVAFSPDGRTAATAEADNRVLLWDVARRAVRDTFSGHVARVTGLSFTHDGRTVLSAGLDGKIMLWDVDDSRRLDRGFAFGPALAHPALSPDSRTLAIPHADGTVSLVEPATLRTRVLRVGRRAARRHRVHGRSSSARDGSARRSRLRRGDRRADREARAAPSEPRLAVHAERRRRRPAHGPRLTRCRGSPTADRRPSGRAPALLPPIRRVRSVTLSPDGRTLAVQTDGGIEIVDVARMRIRGLPPGLRHDRDRAAVHRKRHRRRRQPRGLGAHVVARDVTLRLIAARRAQRRRRRARRQPGRAHARLRRHGRLRSTVRRRHAATAGCPAPGRAREPNVPGLFARRLLPARDHGVGHGYRWDIRPSSWIRRACAIAGRNLTRSEWSDALPGREYAPAC